MDQTLKDHIAVVTGASRGIGRATAIELAKRGAHLVLVARTQGGLEETDDAIRAIGNTATLLPLDLRNGESLDPLGPTLQQRFGRLDILVHNAGVLGKLTPASHILPQDFNECVAVNFASAYRLIRTCAPLLVAAPAGRAVFISTSVAPAPRAFWGAYGSTKAGMENLVLSWAQEVENSNLRINLFNPGGTATRMRAQAFPGEDPNTLPTPEDVAPALVNLCLPGTTAHATRVNYRDTHFAGSFAHQ